MRTKARHFRVMGELGCNKVWEPRAVTELDCLLGTVHRAP